MMPSNTTVSAQQRISIYEISKSGYKKLNSPSVKIRHKRVDMSAAQPEVLFFHLKNDIIGTTHSQNNANTSYPMMNSFEKTCLKK